MSISAINISKYIVTKYTKKEKPITNLQLQKILYFIQKEFLNQNMSFKEDIQAWRFGPVVADVYHLFSNYGAMSIIENYSSEDTHIESKYIEIIDRITKVKSEMSPWALVAETHKENSAWHKTYAGGSGNKNVILPKLIKDDI